MERTVRGLSIAVALAIGALGSWTVLPQNSSALPFPSAYVIKLYSGGKVVGRWRTETLDRGTLSVMTGGGGLIPLGGPAGDMLYLSGTYSIEPETLADRDAD